MCTKIPICKEEYEKNIAETREQRMDGGGKPDLECLFITVCIPQRERMNGQWRMKIIPRKSTGNF